MAFIDSDIIEDENTPPPDELADIQLLNETLKRLLGNLDAREERILRLRYGLQNGHTLTLQEVGHKFGLSRERIRQLEREALIKLQIAASEQRLEQFLSMG